MYFLYFITFSMFGYVYEVLFKLIRHGVLINRGCLLGPWIPLYGMGSILIILLSKKLKEKPGMLLLSSMLACGTLEYLISFFLEKAYNKSWWDYSSYPLNINGRVCAAALLLFGILSLLAVYVFVPLINKFYNKVKDKKVFNLIISILFALFFIDLIHSAFFPNLSSSYDLKL